LPAQEFGYPAEGGAEFVHGAAPVTRSLALIIAPRRPARFPLIRRNTTKTPYPADDNATAARQSLDEVERIAIYRYDRRGGDHAGIARTIS
jgi:hypothetical protein